MDEKEKLTLDELKRLAKMAKEFEASVRKEGE